MFCRSVCTSSWSLFYPSNGLFGVRQPGRRQSCQSEIDLESQLKAFMDIPVVNTFFRTNRLALQSIVSAFKTASKHANLSLVTPAIPCAILSPTDSRGWELTAKYPGLGRWLVLEMLQRYAYLSPNFNSQSVETIANHSTTIFTTTVWPKPITMANLLISHISHPSSVGRATDS